MHLPPSLGEPAPPAVRPSRRRSALLALACLLAVAAIGFALHRLRGPRVRVVQATRRPIVDSVVASGRVRAPARISIAAQVSGVVKTLGAREGERVKAGQLLLALDDTELAAAVAQAEASLDETRAGLDKVEQLNLQLAREELEQAELARAHAAEELRRQQQLAAASAGTRKELDDARRAAQASESQVRAARSRLADAAPKGSERRRAGALRSEAKAALALAHARMTEARVRAPVDGIVLARFVEVGDYVNAGKPLFELAAAGALELVAQLDEKNLGRVHLGQPALAAAEAAPEQTFGAQVSYIAPAVDPQRATVEVRLAVPQAPPLLRPDMTVSIDIRVGERAAALVLPPEAVHDLGGQPWVLVARDGRAVRVPISVGVRAAGFVEVTGGIDGGDAIILASERVRPGARVRPKPAAAPLGS